MGDGFVEYLTKKRIDYSVELLKDESLSVDAIAGMVGYINTPTFIRDFKKIKGVPPGKYRGLL
ncbi:MAG: helix-turn-helix domain-containing protein [Lachnospiraceae bacterium]|nr:helix-turn-helix domain-containing protein [Lachnospiraceae bacterium]